MIKQEELQNNRIDYQFGDKKVVVVDERVIIRTKLEKPSKIKGLALI